jgi:hypothetical protein
VIADLISWVASCLFAIAFILYFFNYWWFEAYLGALAALVEFAITLLSTVAEAVISLLSMLVVGFLKSVVISTLVTLLGLIYLISFVVPHVGDRAQSLKELVRGSLVTSYLVLQSEKMRDIMIEIVAEEDSRDLDFDNPEQYREELTSIKKDGKKRLETGESVLSISLGAVLLGINISGLELLEATIWGYSATFLIQIWLLAITVSIVYRTTALEFLAFSSDDRFDSLEQMDAALGYQKGVSLVGFAQGLTFFVVFTAAISRVKYDLISAALRAKYTDKPWVSLAWKQLKEQ